MSWTEAQVEELKRLAKTDQLFYSEIAQRIGKLEGAVRWKAKRLGLPPKLATHRLAQWNVKHVHISQEVMEFYATHTWQETIAKFSLTLSEWKSLEFYARKRGLTRHKDTRTHDKWTVEELLFVLRHAGIRQRDWIAKQIERGNSRVIKEKLRSLHVNTKTLNGLTISSYRMIFGKEPRLTVAGDAGPNRSGMPTTFKIVPWALVWAEIHAKSVTAPKAFEIVAQTMARFQFWIHGDDPIGSLQLAAEGRHAPPKVERRYFVQPDAAREHGSEHASKHSTPDVSSVECEID